MSRRDVPERGEMEAVIEAILFVSNEPVARDKLLEVFGDRAAEHAAEALETVIERYSESTGGIVIDRAGGGLRLVSRPDLHGYLRRFFEVTGTNKLSMPALETLAIVAYRQPITAPEISELRGVSSQGVLKKLLERRLVRIQGRKEVVGKPFLYGTTREFLMHFGLRRLDELPPLEQFEEMFGGDSEAETGVEPDAEEVIAQEEIEAAEADEAAAEHLREQEDQEQTEAAEAMELAVDAPEPASGAEPLAAPDEESTAEDAVDPEAETSRGTVDPEVTASDEIGTEESTAEETATEEVATEEVATEEVATEEVATEEAEVDPLEEGSEADSRTAMGAEDDTMPSGNTGGHDIEEADHGG